MENNQSQKQDLYAILQYIDEKIKESKIESYVQDVSLYSGLSGIFLFQIYYQKYLNKEKGIKAFSKEKIDLLISIYEDNYHKYKGGAAIFQFAELALFLFHLKDMGFIEKDDLYLLLDEESDSYIFEAIQFYLKNGFIDFLNGASGLGYYLLRRYEIAENKDKIRYYMNSFVEIVESTSIKASYPLSGLYWKSFGILDKSWGINLGMAHGIPSMALLLLKYYPYVNNKNKQTIFNLIEGVINFMESIRYSSDKATSFPGHMELDFSIHPTSTFIAWCYGDVPMARLYKIISSIFPEFSTYSKLADEILEKAFNRDLTNEILTHDISLCHGAAGVVMMYLTQVYHRDIEKKMNRDIDFWINNLYHLLYFLKENKSAFNLKDFNLLEGISGVGLCLLECHDKQNSLWKEFFLYK